MFGVIESVFHMHGAVEIETPVFELKVGNHKLSKCFAILKLNLFAVCLLSW